MKNRLNELCDIIEKKDRQLRIVRNGLNEKDLEIGKLYDRIRALEYNCGRLQSVIESVGFVYFHFFANFCFNNLKFG